ncbi:GNAT family N-acetyltransferase [Pararhodobacter zhoushanensis]|uniref:GNAT family N-acetyltransferase n=1 Tax=Pararhodobacter zhoushanensis TaxID=2479545 RepID=A0ABT3H247_9RHOB|nr:GNAT family N-acetyltransferase [Pararhodobacter zhoushanensis]MCW1933846.1 GNAT family N-acetyltransferase [Pararhodobacter zhoushanensis]
MEISLHPVAASDAAWLIERHHVLYAQDEGFDDSFGALVAQIVTEFLATRIDGREQGWIAWRDGRRLGSIFVVQRDAQVAKLRLFLLEPEARGTGLAQRMLEQAFGFARAAGYAQIVLWTHESHRAAGRLYARNGFALVESEPQHSFGQDVVAQTWHRNL